MKYGSLFSGIGGLDLAVEAFFPAEPAWQCEISPFCRSVLAKHWPNVPRHDDVCALGIHDETCDLDDDCSCQRAHSIEPVDIICGGFPCQDVSSAGKRAGIDDGKKSGLWREYLRIVRELRPSVVLVENVTSGLGRWLPRVLGDLAALGFDAEWETVAAHESGAPHRRLRTFVLAYTDSEHLREQLRRSETGAEAAEPRFSGEAVAHPAGGGALEHSEGIERSASFWHFADGRGARAVAHAESNGREGYGLDGLRIVRPAESLGRHVFPPPRDPSSWAGWDGPEPGVRRDAYGLPGSVESKQRRARLHALGNAVVPQQALLALDRMAARAALGLRPRGCVGGSSA